MRSHLLRLPDELLDQIDQTRGDVPRNTWIRRLIEANLQPQSEMPPLPPPPSPPARTSGNQYDDALARQAKLNQRKYGDSRR